MSIPALIISKDRACQADLLIRSIKQNNPIFDLSVIYTTSNDSYEKGYDILRKLYPDILFIKEIDCTIQLYAYIDLCTTIYGDNTLIGFFADDCIFYRPSDICETRLKVFFERENHISFTYRLGRNITIQDYIRNNPTQRPDQFCVFGKILKWDYTIINPEHSFGWPCGIDSFIYKASKLKQIMNNNTFDNFTKLEGLLVDNVRKNFKDCPFMGCSENSCVIVEQCNVVHQNGLRSAGKFSISTEELNKKFLEGKIVSLESMDFTNIVCTHGEFPWNWE